MSVKKRILFVSEAPFLYTGYSTYGKEIFNRLHGMDKYDLAMLGAYASWMEPEHARKIQEIPYRFYGNLPDKDNQQEMNDYHNNIRSHFGGFRFNDVALDFKPQVCCSFTDPWMYDFLLTSPFRPFYKTNIMVTVDGYPQQTEWYAMYKDINEIFTYTDWGKKVVEEESGGNLKVRDVCPPAADMNVYKPILNKKGHKKALGLDENSLIVGMYSRNQRRKLFPDLFKGFRQYLDYCGEHHPALGKKSYLHIYTSYPDVGWDFPKLLKEHKLSHKVIFTYHCRSCGLVYPSFWQDARTFCPRCKQPNAAMSNTQQGVSSQAMATLMNICDIYVQYACRSGIEMHAIEAAACGIPLMVTNYGGVSDLVKKCKAMPLEVAALSREPETGSYNAVPNNDDFVQKLFKFFNLPESLRIKRGIETRKLCEQNFSYDASAKKWANYFDSVEVTDHWQNPPNLHFPSNNYPPNLTNNQLVEWGILNILRDPSKLNTYFHLKLLRDLNYGMQQEGGGSVYMNENSMFGQPKWRPYGPPEVLSQLYQMREEINLWEQRRCGMVPYNKPKAILNCKQ